MNRQWMPLLGWALLHAGAAPAAAAAEPPPAAETGSQGICLPPSEAIPNRFDVRTAVAPQPCWPPFNCLNTPIWIPCDGADPKLSWVPPAGIWNPILPTPTPPLEPIPQRLPDSPDTIPPLPEGPALELRQVLECVDRQFPLLLAIEQEREIALGQRLAAEGAFDLSLKSRAAATPEGSYPNRRFDLGVEQPTTLYGMSYFAGYRLGLGDFPVYKGGEKTADGGEFRAGVSMPLLRGGPIDRQRAALRQAQIAQQIAEPTIQQARIGFLRAAARAYWTWIARGEQVRIARRILEIAVRRQAILEARLKAEAARMPDVTDNRRIIAQRERLLAGVEREFQKAAFELSLYLRDAEGQPLTPSASQLPSAFLSQEPPPPASDRLKQDIETAFTLRPELQRFPLLRERAGVELRLAENQLYPALNFSMSGGQDVGAGKKDLDRSSWDLALSLDVPLQRREALGRATAARAAMLQLSAQETYARDQIVAEVQNAVSEIDRSFRRLIKAQEEKKEAELMLRQEEARYAAGAIDLFVVNIREQQAADALFAVVDSMADCWRAQADLRAALGLDARQGP